MCEASAVSGSIVIVSFNSRIHLERCLNAIARTTSSSYEIVVVDNASTDGSADFVAARFPWVRLIRSADNEGFAAGNNRGVAAAHGQYIVALNPDTEVMPGWLDALLGPLRDEPGGAMAEPLPVGLSTARLLMMGARDRVNACGNLPHYTGITTCLGLGLPAEAPELARSVDVPAVSGACFAIRRDLWEALGGFDEDFFTYLEDTDLSLRAHLLGYRCRYVPEAVVYHAYTNRFSARKLYYLERNRAMMLLKIYRWRTLALMLPALLLAECVTWGYALMRGSDHLRAKLEACGWVVTHRRAILRRRRAVQATRIASDGTLLRLLAQRLDVAQLAGAAVGRIAKIGINPLFAAWGRVLRLLP